MPIVSKIKRGWNGTMFLRVTRFTSGNSRSGIYDKFTVELPPDVRSATGKSEVEGKTKVEAEDAFDAFLSDYQDKGTTTRAVIGYSLNYQIDTQRGRKKYSGKTGYFSDSSDTEVSFKYHVFVETNFDGELNYAHKDGGYIAERDYDHIIEWTAHREAFFKQLQTNLEDVIIMIMEFFKGDKPPLKKIDSESLKLLT